MRKFGFSVSNINFTLLPEQAHISTHHKLPWWTWVAPIVLIEIGNQLSLSFRYSETFSLFYLPTAVATVLIFWWGPARVIPALFIEATINCWYYSTQHIWLWPVFGFTEAFTTMLSWLLFNKWLKGKFWLPDTYNTVLFLLLGLCIPSIIKVLGWGFLYIIDGTMESSQYWSQFSMDLLSEIIVGFCFVLPVLFFLTPKMNSRNYLLQPVSTIVTYSKIKTKYTPELAISFLLLSTLVFTLKFEFFSLFTGLFSLYFAIRFGFGMALVGNAYIFFVSYLLPSFFRLTIVEANSTNVYLGSCLLFLFATITGRVISDLKTIRKRLYRQNLELTETNQELDRFVYSVSHDLSAPLKSILGLVNISKLNNNPEEHKIYFHKIENSVVKLDEFIKEVLDYSRNKRLALTIEQFRLKDLCTEILENLKHLDGFQDIDVDISNLHFPQIRSDKTRIRMILNNLIANSIKYQKNTPQHRPYIRISSRRKDNTVVIEVEDNGEGIKPEVQEKIFNMFYRGHENSKGSGLGLYIAREAAEKIEGTIAVKSEYGKGSIFTLELKNLN